jgi:YHS domain-containing protein
MRLLLWLILGYVLFKIAKGFLASRPTTAPPAAKGEETFRDPVCGTYVAEADAVIGRHEEERIHFCSMDCLEKYRDQLAHQSSKREDRA